MVYIVNTYTQAMMRAENYANNYVVRKTQLTEPRYKTKHSAPPCQIICDIKRSSESLHPVNQFVYNMHAR